MNFNLATILTWSTFLILGFFYFYCYSMIVGAWIAILSLGITASAIAGYLEDLKIINQYTIDEF